MTPLQERLQREANKKYPVDDFHGHHIIAPEDLKNLISHTISETIKEAVRVIEGEKHPNLSAMEKGSEFMTPRMYRALGHNDALSTAIPERVEEFREGVQNAPDTDEYIVEHLPILLTETDQQAREECIAIVEEYGKNIQKLHEEMIGTTHEDCKQMLAYDMHSRLIAVKHILKYISNPPSQV